MERLIPILSRVPLKQRIVDNPEEVVAGFINQVQFASEVRPQVSECIGDNVRLIGDEEHDVARLRASPLPYCLQLPPFEKLDDAR